MCIRIQSYWSHLPCACVVNLDDFERSNFFAKSKMRFACNHTLKSFFSFSDKRWIFFVNGKCLHQWPSTFSESWPP